MSLPTIKRIMLHLIPGFTLGTLLLMTTDTFAAGKASTPAVGDIVGVISLTSQLSNCQIEGSHVYIPGISHFAELGADGNFKLAGVKTSTAPYTVRLKVKGANEWIDTSVLVDKATVTQNISADSLCPEGEQCNDNNACTFDSVANNLCSHTPISCDDNDPKTMDSCDTSIGCQHVVIPDCRDGETLSCYTGPAGSAGTGQCANGTQTCSSGTYGACVGEVLPETEVCDDAIDNDCDGATDEGCSPPILCEDGDIRPCYTGPAGSAGYGQCATGTQICSSGTFGVCTGEVLPETEVCGDAIDNDCDGTTDEGCSNP
jgi:hypothetical protein